jgi:hypothetical protein
MAGDASGSVTHLLADLPYHPAVVEERHVLGPREPHHDEEPVLGGEVQQPARRRRIGPDRGQAGGPHHLEVPVDDVGLGIVRSVPSGSEGPIGHAGQVGLPAIRVEEAARDCRPRSREPDVVSLLAGLDADPTAVR